ncbi:putative monooxygenase [Violaceomyces palustris]|uniref:Monooxygenase n=1 Tax=Violaceomyces palustris TaxID=1673888 RepID=A0ACD0P2I2_9BASI|nr:putative monooxygenase [Violaceomyces palustris]
MGSIPLSDSDIQEVIIVGAGISGINAAYRFQDANPGRRYTILEARSNIGGTWDLFKYPGIRSDSDLHTFGYAFKEWTGPDIAEAKYIVEYLENVVQENHIKERIRFNTKVVSADFSTEDRAWSVKVETNGRPETLRSRFVFLATGYYDYSSGLKAEIPGIHNFGGRVVHPQFWDLEPKDYRDKRVVVIGSGATAITLIPSMADETKSITMLQRSPSYIVALPKHDPFASLCRAILPASWASKLIRQKNIARIYASYHFMRRFPNVARRYLRFATKKLLPKNIPLDPHFKPRYNPWDQRLCICPDGDFYETLRSGKASIVTGEIEEVTQSSIRLKSGETLDADVIVTATGLKMQIGGSVDVSVDGETVKPNQRFVWRGSMLEGVPNLALFIGYTNASWTLGSDCTAHFMVRLMAKMDKEGKSMVVPRLESRESIKEAPLINLNSTYVQKASENLPKASSEGPWRLRTNYWYDLIQAKYGGLQGLTFA